MSSAGDLPAGLLTAGFGAAVVSAVRGFPQLPGGQPGPALFPGIIGGLMIVFGLALTAQALTARRRAGLPEAAPDAQDAAEQRDADPRARMPPRTATVNAVAVLGAVVAYLLLADLLGFVITMASLLTVLMVKLGTRLRVAVPAALATAAVILVLFGQVLLVPLPPGPFGPIG